MALIEGSFDGETAWRGAPGRLAIKAPFNRIKVDSKVSLPSQSLQLKKTLYRLKRRERKIIFLDQKRRMGPMAIFEVNAVDTHEHEQIQKYAEFVNCIYIGGYLVSVRSIHHEPDCPHKPICLPGRAEEIGKLNKCSVMPNGVHVHLYSSDSQERYIRFIEVSDAENEALFAAYYG